MEPTAVSVMRVMSQLSHTRVMPASEARSSVGQKSTVMMVCSPVRVRRKGCVGVAVGRKGCAGVAVGRKGCEDESNASAG